MRLSIVTTLYRSAPYIGEFCRRAGEAAARITDDYEIVLVNDGSPDDSLAVAVAAYERDPHIRVIDLSRNFGHHRAMMTGLAHARGDRVFLLDADLEQQPELLPQFAAEMERSGADVVYGVQSKRTGGLGERVIGSLYYKLFNFLSSTEIPANIVTMRLMTRRYVAALVRHREREILIGGLGERVIGSLYYKLFNFLSSTEIPANIVTMRLMTRRYVAALVRHREREI